MRKNTLRQIVFPLLLGLGVAAGVWLGSWVGSGRIRTGVQRHIALAPQHPESKITTLLNLIDEIYLEPVNLDSVTEEIMPMIVGELDPHSIYIPAREFARANETLDAEFDGIGVMFNMLTDTVVIVNVIDGGPSQRAGVLNGDRIIRIGDSLVAGRGVDQEDIVKMLRGPRGSAVKLGLQRHGLASLLDVEVVRDKIPVRSLTAGFLIEPGTAYLKLGSFARFSDLEIDTTLVALRGQGMQRLILDLRGNSGGFMAQAINIANKFLPADRLIVYTEDRLGRQTKEFSSGNGKFRDLPLAILIDEFSASSSEILAGAIQDHDRGLIIGRRSFGKGLVQEQRMFDDGSAVRLTVARYFTPSGRSIQKPYTNDSEEYYKDVDERYRHQEFFEADSIKFADSLRFTTTGGRTVYGGGGIMPDIFVPLDTTDMSRYFMQVTLSNTLLRYTLEYADRHRDALNNIRTLEQLHAFLDADKTLLDDFVKYAAAHGIKRDAAGIEQSRTLLLAQLRGFIGRSTELGDAGFYSNIYRADNVLLRAIEELRGKQ